MAEPTEAMPVLYSRPAILTLERHRDTGIAEITNFAFARAANSLPVGADEMLVAQSHYPLVFTGSDPALPVAVLGIDKNLFVEDDGKWRAGTYLPAYIRRYPFLLARGASPKETYLAFDEASFCVTGGEGQRLFDGDAPSPLARRALEFCLAYEIQLDIARAFGEAARAAGILVTQRADLRLGDGSRFSLEGFRVIDEARFDTLSSEIFLTWRRNGWLGLAYAHLLSMRKWQDLAIAGTG
jgi:hypothetical protein